MEGDRKLGMSSPLLTLLAPPSSLALGEERSPPRQAAAVKAYGTSDSVKSDSVLLRIALDKHYLRARSESMRKIEGEDEEGEKNISKEKVEPEPDLWQPVKVHSSDTIGSDSDGDSVDAPAAV